MCLIIQAKNPKVITDNMMNCAYSNNDDGFGLMFHNKGKVHIHKIGTYIKIYSAVIPNKSIQLA